MEHSSARDPAKRLSVVAGETNLHFAINGDGLLKFEVKCVVNILGANFRITQGDWPWKGSADLCHTQKEEWESEKSAQTRTGFVWFERVFGLL